MALDLQVVAERSPRRFAKKGACAMFRGLLFAGALLISASAFAATEYVFTGTYHNDRSRHRATIETDTGRYVLDFPGSDLYHLGERFDRENVVVEGKVDYYPRDYDYPVIRVEKITFRPYHSRSVTYRASAPVYETYTTYERPVIREHRVIVKPRVIRRYYVD
jgi:hypothetical protein